MHPAVSTTTRPNDAAAGIQPVARIDDERWVCHIGLDAGASGFFNDLYQRSTRRGVPACSFRDPADMLEVERGSRETRMLLRPKKRRMGGS